MRLLKNSSLARNASWMFLGNVFSSIFQAANFFFAARILGVAQWGIYAGAMALIALVSNYSTFGSGFLFLRYVSGHRGRFAAYWGNILFSTAAVGGALVLLTTLFGGKAISSGNIYLLIYVAVGDCICAQFIQCCAQIFQAFEKMQITAGLTILTNILRMAVVLVLFFKEHTLSVTAWAFWQMLISVVAALAAAWMVFARFGRPSWQAGLFRKHWFEAITFALSCSTTSAYNDIDKTMLSHYGMNAANGVYSMAYRVINIATMPVRSIQSAAFPRYCVLGSEGIGPVFKYAVKITKRTVIAGVLIAIGLWIVAPLMPILAGKGFEEGASAIRWLCLLPLFRALQFSAGDAITGAGYQSHRFGIQLIAALGNYLVNLWLIPHYGWPGAAWSSLGTDGGLALMNWALLVWMTSRHMPPGQSTGTAAAIA